MLDIRYVRDNQEAVAQAMANRNFPWDAELFASLDRIDLIKCDIEGYELVVMTEMRPLLERHHPTVLIETGGDNRPRIVALFGSIGYDGYVLSEGTMRPLADGDTKDIVFVHRSRRERYQKLIRP